MRGGFFVFLLGLGLAISATSPAVSAEPDRERDALARLAHELRVLETLVDEAERAADSSRRFTFQYPWLRDDLTRVRLGINAHLAPARPEPRTFPALRGDYRR